MKLIIFNKKQILFGLTLVSFLLSCNHTNSAEKTTIADNGLALHSVVISSDASNITRDAAKNLSEYLGRITGGVFPIIVGDGTEGIAVGNIKNFPQLKLANLFDPGILTRRDEYLLRTHCKGVYLIGATDLAAQHAVWGFLSHLGYRQFFPTDHWEIIPNKPNLNAELNTFEQPDFYNRSAPRNAPYSDKQLWQRWHDRNRMTSSFEVNTTHIYNDIIRRNQATFDKHPEYFALVNGVRSQIRESKFCISNENLRQLVVEDAKRRVEETPEATSISMDPSDGGDWCECETCAEMGSVSDRVVVLANEVAEAINNIGYGEKYVAIYAYNQHSPPPNIDVHPKVIVSIATAFLRGGYTLEELIEGWSKHTEMIGIREYHDVSKWSFGLPRKAIGGNINYLVEKIPYFYNQGARFINSESMDSWVPNGLGYYLSALLLWDLNTVDRVDEIIEDFVVKSFGKAYEPMRKFYSMINEDHVTLRSNEDLLAHMYEYIKEARGLTKDPKVNARLDDLALYSRFVELWLNYEISEGKSARNKAAQDLYLHTYRMQNTMLVHIYSLYLHMRRAGIDIPEEAIPGAVSLDFPFSRLAIGIKERTREANPGDLYTVGQKLEDFEPWKSSKLFTDDEIAQIIEDGVATYRKDKMDFQPINFSEDLAPASQALKLREVTTGDMGGRNVFRGRHKIFTWLKTNNQLTLDVVGGLSYQNRGNVRFMLYSPQEVLVEPVDINNSVPPDGEVYKIVLKSPYIGQHELEWMDGLARTRLTWPEDQPMTVQASMENPKEFRGKFKLYFYVPKGTQILGGYTSNNNFQVFDSNENSVLDLRKAEGGEGYFNVHVPQGQDGTLWELRGSNSTLMLMTVPPYLARNEKELLLPKEVIEADKLK